MSALNESPIVEELKRRLEAVNAANTEPGLNETDKLLDADLASVLAEACGGSKTLRELVAAILAEYPVQQRLP